jgi:hypothetical protein
MRSRAAERTLSWATDESQADSPGLPACTKQSKSFPRICRVIKLAVLCRVELPKSRDLSPHRLHYRCWAEPRRPESGLHLVL